MLKEDMVKQVKQATEIAEEAIGALGDSLQKTAVIISLIKQLDITDLHEATESIPHKLQRAIPIPIPRLRPAPPGCPLITSLNCIHGDKDVLWRGTCTYLDFGCPDIDKALSFNDYCNCNTYMASKIQEARENDAESNDRD